MRRHTLWDYIKHGWFLNSVAIILVLFGLFIANAEQALSGLFVTTGIILFALQVLYSIGSMHRALSEKLRGTIHHNELKTSLEVHWHQQLAFGAYTAVVVIIILIIVTSLSSLESDQRFEEVTRELQRTNDLVEAQQNASVAQDCECSMEAMMEDILGSFG